MATMVKVTPGKGRVVRLKAGGKPMKETGATVERTVLIERWIANGDLVVANAEAVVEAPAVPAPKAPAIPPKPDMGAKS